MPVSFPPTPATNDEYTFGSTTWVFNGVGWAVVAPTGSGGRQFLVESFYWDQAPGAMQTTTISEKTYA